MNAICQRLKLERNGKPVWRYQSVEEGRGKRTGRLTGPFYIRPTVRTNGTATQAWVRLTADNFDEAKAEAEQRGAAFEATAKGLTVAEAEAVSNAGRNPIKVAIEAGNEEEASSLVARALTHGPNDLVANEYHAKLQLGNGQLSGARQTLERLVQLDPQSSRFHLLLGRVLARLNYSAEAEREFQLSKDLALKQSLEK